jgi:hypothetical protein
MRLVTAVVLAVLMIPAAALATDLEDRLAEGRDATYSAEQIITCSTPEGVKDSVVRIRQSGGDMYAAASVPSDVEVTSGYGGWTLSQAGSVVTSTALDGSGIEAEPRYDLDAGTPAAFLGRRVTLYEMRDGDLLRARLIFDNQVGALMKAVTYSDDGDVYCERRFITFDPSPPPLSVVRRADAEVFIDEQEVDSGLPEEIAGFFRLDEYAEDGLTFAYYSDGFFSFAVFETDVVVDLDHGARVTIDEDEYRRAFSPGQVTFVWETPSGGMALIGDLPPDMHEGILDELPQPGRAGWWGRLWRGLFG